MLRIVGDAASDMTRLDAPTLDVLADRFHVLGRSERLDGDAREFAYDLQPLRADVDVVPSLALPYLDPGPPARWAVARTEPIASLA